MPSFRNLIQRRKKVARSSVDGQVASTATASEALLENVAEASITAPVPSVQTPAMVSSEGAESKTITEHLWSRAYQALREREQELMDAYESYLGICAGDDCAGFSNPEAGAELIRKLQEDRNKKHWRFSFGGKDHKMRDQVEKLVKLLLFSDAVIKQAASARPHAVLAWSGVSMFLPARLRGNV
ncbi:hypothetical protein LEL_08347 [Akanthomyces lecanii RCEF 1005]|uniref:NWD NACHT-NTPase N-terminal domain-containing protein n=1 Tax=Akanthomyces lecanii RCEF 1005 TaxID=1081108 RepID=A0A168F7B2_CORDF|nr:hypothetical protein LEL_08347 [Akanthomyces lecanii RCEF 1005]